jgi:hypothetical protein
MKSDKQPADNMTNTYKKEQGMGREEARAKGWNTWRENLYQYAKEHPEFSLTDFILQRMYGAIVFCRKARDAERGRDYKKARDLYLKATESLTQTEKLAGDPITTACAEQLKAEYFDFVAHRDPYYRHYLKYFLPVIKAEPGILQTDMYKRFNLPRPEITYTLYFAEKEGLVRRENKGRSYQLFFEREKPADEPLLSIQDDEIDIRERDEDAAAVKKGCLFIFSCIFWGGIFMVAAAYTGPVGAGIVAVAFIVWRIIRKKRREKGREKPKQEPAGPLLPETQEKGQEEPENQEKTP